MRLIDTHAHIYLPEFDIDRTNMIHDAAGKGVGNILLPAIDSSTHPHMLAVEKQFNMCVPMMGLHPCSVKENFRDELRIVEDWLRARSFIAIGETGLDFYWDVTFEKEQYAAFHQQIEWCLEFDVPVVIHSRKSTDECISVVKQYPKLRGVFHCFSGTEEQAAQLTELRFLLGIGGVLTFKNSGLDKAIQGIDLKHIILETDAPYLAPVPFRGKRNEPARVRLVAERIAALRGVPYEEFAASVWENAHRVFPKLIAYTSISS